MKTVKENDIWRQRRPTGVETGAQKQEMQNKKEERRLLGKNLRLVQRISFAASAKQAGRVNGRRTGEAAAKNEDYEGFDEEDQIKRKKEWTLKTDGGLLSCWRQTARKHGSIQERKKPCKSGMLGWRQ